MSARVLMVDNYDSFTYNLVHLFGEFGADVVVRRNDAISADEAEQLAPSHLVVSPGPGRPEDAGASLAVLDRLCGRVPTLGVCLGHQAIGAALGGRIVGAKRIMHGKTSLIHHDGAGVFRGLEDPFVATRYHSLVIDPADVPADLVVTAWTDDGEIMGVRHRRWPLEGVQFHPESILTVAGKRLLQNFLDRVPGA
jgi:anthranilate synthase/aminodeoxychorismate synthase-like glutamine amidotransferase